MCRKSIQEQIPTAVGGLVRRLKARLLQYTLEKNIEQKLIG